MAKSVCSVAGCPELTNGGRCDDCKRGADKARRPDGNPYNTPGHKRFRREVLATFPICVLCHLVPSTVADHYPRTRRELVELHLDPDDPDRGRGLCESCHNRHTAATSPGGWNAPQT